MEVWYCVIPDEFKIQGETTCMACIYLFLFSFQPENLLYATDTDDSILKLADFGLSKMLTTDVLMQTVCGTPGYCGMLRDISCLSHIKLQAI